jgi:hypothetical protein
MSANGLALGPGRRKSGLGSMGKIEFFREKNSRRDNRRLSRLAHIMYRRTFQY